MSNHILWGCSSWGEYYKEQELQQKAFDDNQEFIQKELKRKGVGE